MKEDIEKELVRITEELEAMEDSGINELKTIDFFSSQADGLLKKIYDDSISLDEKEKIYKQIESLYKRVLLEKQIVIERDEKLEKLVKEFNLLNSLI